MSLPSSSSSSPDTDPRSAGSIVDVAGIEVGHFSDPRRPTGCTVILAREGAVGGVDVRGAAPGTRETDLLAPGNLVERVHGVMLAGGSAWGLAAADGAMRWLEEHGVGMDKSKYMPRMYDENDLDTMQLVRCAFDPSNISNPGKVFPTPRLCGEVPGRHKGAHPLQEAGLAEVF